MNCFNPVRIYHDRYIPNSFELYNRHIVVPCGKCHACLSQKTSELITRLSHESFYYNNGIDSMFLTLTYSDDNLPFNNSLCKRDVQLFLKRLRKKCDKLCIKIKVSYVGEYGLKRRRPHYHAILFGLSYFDKFHRFLVDSSWNLGFTYFGTVTDNSIAYCSGYMLKQGTFETGRYNIIEYKNDYYDKLIASGVCEFDAKVRVDNLKVKRSDYYRWRYGREMPFRVWSKGLGKRYLFDFKDNLVSSGSVPRTYMRWLYHSGDFDSLDKLAFIKQSLDKIKFVNFCKSHGLRSTDLTPLFDFHYDDEYYNLYNYLETRKILDSMINEHERCYRVKFDDYMSKLYSKKKYLPLEVA